MAVDLRPYNCLPEHQGPAFRTWARIIQTAAMNSGSPTSPLLSPNSYSNFDSSFPSLIPAEEFIPFKSSEDLKKRKITEATNDSSDRTTDGLHANGSQMEDVSSLTYAPWKKRAYPENAYGLHLEVKDFYEYMSPSPEEAYMRKDVVERITNLINGIWPAAKVEIFGSYKTNLYLPTSDIDLVVFGCWEKLPLWTLERALINQDIAEQSTIKVLDKASVPIVKLTDKCSNIKVDISFNMDTAVKGAELIQDFLKEYKVLPCLFLILKHFLVMRDLNEVFTGGISSYCLMLLAISFLQMHPRQESKLANANLGVLLIEFFELYGRNFNYQRTGIKIRSGGCYCSKDEIMREMVDGQFPSLLCIEDPVSKVIDIGKSSFGILRVKEAFEYAYNVLDSALRNRHYFKINPESTYLSRIIQVPMEIVQYRKWVKQQYKVACEQTVNHQNTSNQNSPRNSNQFSEGVDIVNSDDFPPLESSNPISARRSAASGICITPNGTSPDNQPGPLYSSVGSSNKALLTLPLPTRSSDSNVSKTQKSNDQAAKGVAVKDTTVEDIARKDVAAMDVAVKENSKETIAKVASDIGKSDEKKNTEVVEIGWTNGDDDDDDQIDDFILEPYIQGLSWSDLCEVDDDEEPQGDDGQDCHKTEPVIGSGGASTWSGDEISPHGNKTAQRPTHLAAGHLKFSDDKYHNGKKHGHHYRNRRPRSPCEGIGEQDLASARQARQLIISSPEKPIVKPEKWAREEGRQMRDQKHTDHNRGHEEKFKGQRIKTSSKDSHEHHGEVMKHPYEQNYQEDNHHSHKYGSGHRRRNKRDSKPF